MSTAAVSPHPSAHRARPVLPAILLTLLLADVLVLGLHARVYYDWWWQMANGRLLWTTRQFLRTDPYTFTIQGQPYIDKYWLAELFLFPLFHHFSFAGATALHLLLLAGIASGVWRIARTAPFPSFLLLALPALVLFEQRSSLRIYLFSYLLLPPFLRLAWNTLGPNRPIKWKAILALAALQCLWANLHSGFLWGWIITATLAAVRIACSLHPSRRPSDLGAALAGPSTASLLVLTAPFLNPYGHRLLTDALKGAFAASTHAPSVEWQPLLAIATPLTLTAWIILLVCSALLVVRAADRLPALLLLGIGAVLSLTAYRHIGAFALLAVSLPFVANGPKRQLNRPLNLHPAASIPAALALLGFFYLVCSHRLFFIQHELKRFGFGPITSELPVKCADFARQTRLRGRFLNHWQYGGYLIWRLWPDILVSEDGRTAPFPAELHRQLEAIFDGDLDQLRSFNQRYHLTGAVVPWYCGSLISRMARDPFWECVFIGPHSTLWLTQPALRRYGLEEQRITLQTAGRFILRSPDQARAEDPWLTYPTALFRRGLVLLCLGQVAAAHEELRLLEQVAPDSPLTHRLRQLMTLPAAS